MPATTIYLVTTNMTLGSHLVWGMTSTNFIYFFTVFGFFAEFLFFFLGYYTIFSLVSCISIRVSGIIYHSGNDGVANSVATSAMVVTEALHGLFTHRQLNASVILLWRFRLKVSPSRTICCFLRSLMTKFRSLLVSVSVWICKKKLKRMKQNKMS